jgi:hypothetical protein
MGAFVDQVPRPGSYASNVAKLVPAPLFPPVRVNSSPALADLDGDGVKGVVVGGADGADPPDETNCSVTALSGATGEQLWSFATKGGTWSSPRLVELDGDGVPDVVIGSADGHVYLISGKDGGLVHRYRAGGPVYSSPATADLDGDGTPELVFGSLDNHVYAFSLLPEHMTGRRRVPPLPMPLTDQVEAHENRRLLPKGRLLLAGQSRRSGGIG